MMRVMLIMMRVMMMLIMMRVMLIMMRVMIMLIMMRVMLLSRYSARLPVRRSLVRFLLWPPAPYWLGR